MKGFVHSFESFGTVDGPGIRFVVFLQGCPMRCLYCHNPDTREAGGKEYEAREVFEEILKYERYISSGGVTVSGGEPLLQTEFLTELFSLLKARGIHTAIDTSGCVYNEEDAALKEKLNGLLSVTDLVLLDIKEIDEEKHRRLTGRGNRNILAFARFLAEKGIKIWVRHVLLEGYTDTDEDLEKTAKFAYSLQTVEKAEILPYHTMGRVKYEKMGLPYPLNGVEPPTKERVQNAKRIFAEAKKRAEEARLCGEEQAKN